MENIETPLPENRVEPNDKLTKKIFNMDDQMIRTRGFSLIENREKTVKTPVDFDSESLKKLDSHDREVAMACFSLKAYGNEYATSEQIYRIMTGDDKARIYPIEELKIKKSLEHLISTSIKIGLSGLSQLGYKCKDLELFGTVLPAQFLNNVTINGSKARLIIRFLGESPLVTVARLKNNQLLTYKLEIANVGGRNSPERIALKNYILRRIEECKLHSQMSRSITFSDIWEKNNMTDKSKTEKKRYRDFILNCFKEWKQKKLIKNYEEKKSKSKAHGYHSISFMF